MIGLTKGESNREGVWGTWYWATRVRVTRGQLQPFTEVGEADIFEGSESRWPWNWLTPLSSSVSMSCGATPQVQLPTLPIFFSTEMKKGKRANQATVPWNYLSKRTSGWLGGWVGRLKVTLKDPLSRDLPLLLRSRRSTYIQSHIAHQDYVRSRLWWIASPWTLYVIWQIRQLFSSFEVFLLYGSSRLKSILGQTLMSL